MTDDSLNTGEWRKPPAEMSYGHVRVRYSHRAEGDPTKGFVPAYHFRILNEQNQDVGHINFRVGETEHVLRAAGHIGFEIDPAHRGQGFAARACLALAPFVCRISQSVIITADPDNVASIRTLERIGAVYLDEVDVPEVDPHRERGSPRKRRYQWTPGEGGAS